MLYRFRERLSEAIVIRQISSIRDAIHNCWQHGCQSHERHNHESLEAFRQRLPPD